jgi:hypothetical protein
MISFPRILGVLSLLALASCDFCAGVSCDVCGPALFLRVTDTTTGMAVPGLTATLAGTSYPCSTTDQYSDCSYFGSALRAGTYEIDLAAPGYQPRHLTEVVQPSEPGGCCNCGYVMHSDQVTLQRQ